jgi:GT2 family glycosyltransferase
MNTLIGFVTYGGLEFTKLLVRGVRETVTRPHRLLAVVGKPGDSETAGWLRDSGIAFIRHHENRGFPASLNDLLDEAFVCGRFDALVICGNDVVPYPGAIDAMIATAEETDFEWVAASQFDVQTLLAMYPQAESYFHGNEHRFTDFAARPWELHAAAVAACPPGTDSNPAGPALIKDVQNLCLYRRSVFEKIGYFDANFWPNGYFSDNDYARRGVNAGLRCCALRHAQYFHFWSRTIHQGEARPNGLWFGRNEAFYREKWGGPFGAETGAEPAGGLKIAGRADEDAAVAHWRGL